jgi:hypothetical protein
MPSFVFGTSRSRSSKYVPTVDVRTTGRDSSPRAADTNAVVDVLPFVPVTPTAKKFEYHAGGAGTGAVLFRA